MFSSAQAITLFIIILFPALIYFFKLRIQAGRGATLRPIKAFDVIKMLTARAIETGKTLHFSLGIGRVTNQTTSDTLAGLTTLDYVAQESAAANITPLVTMADPVTMLLAQNRLRDAHRASNQDSLEAANGAQWISSEPTAYAAGVMGILGRDDISGNIMIGYFGDEYLLMGEAAYYQENPIPTVAGASDPNVVPYVYATAPKGLWGEEIFAAGAYLQENTIHIASLFAQDTVRWGIGCTILIIVTLRGFGVLG